MKHLISVGVTVFLRDKAIVETSNDWWFERFTYIDKNGKIRIKSLMYPCKLLRAVTEQGLKIIFPSDYKIHKDEWIVKLDNDSLNLHTPQMLFQEFCKLNGYGGNSNSDTRGSTSSKEPSSTVQK